MSLTFGEKLEIDGLRDEIDEQIETQCQFWNQMVMFKLRKISKIGGKKEANKAIRELGLCELGWKEVDENV